jgi:hypothetical protein
MIVDNTLQPGLNSSYLILGKALTIAAEFEATYFTMHIPGHKRKPEPLHPEENILLYLAKTISKYISPVRIVRTRRYRDPKTESVFLAAFESRNYVVHELPMVLHYSSAGDYCTFLETTEKHIGNILCARLILEESINAISLADEELEDSWIQDRLTWLMEGAETPYY